MSCFRSILNIYSIICLNEKIFKVKIEYQNILPGNCKANKKDKVSLLLQLDAKWR